jgi:UDP-N-acetylmuramoyl-tripeptide--D-alanyl-D-alanine ligase
MQIEKIIQNPKLISIDSRTIKKNGIFVAIKGKRFDGHDFVEKAFRKGARLAIVSRKPKVAPKHKKRLIMVRNTVTTLGNIAASHRARFDIPVIAITGTNGKTTAKDMASHVLSSKYNVLKNETSKNNDIGLPLTLLKLTKKHDVAIVEMGMNHLGEIARLAEIAGPDIGVITNIGPAHLESLGTLKNILIAKSELLKRLRRNGPAILNKDDAYLRAVKGLKCKKIYFGIESVSDFRATNLSYRKNKWSFRLAGTNENFELSLFGKHNIYNALIAIALAGQFGIGFSTIAKRIASYRQASPMRMGFESIRGIGILDDTYNSNPLSMECAIDTLSGYNTRGKRIVVSGDMLELGKKAKTMHEAMGRVLASRPIDVLITHGRLSLFMNKEARKRGMESLYHARLHSDAAGFLRKVARSGDVILVKGSRGMRMEKVIEQFKGV